MLCASLSVKAFKRSMIRNELNLALPTSIPLKVLCFCLFVSLHVDVLPLKRAILTGSVIIMSFCS